MADEKQRRMAFYEIGRGEFARAMQREFENAQSVAIDRNLPVKITANILIAPPDKDDENYGKIGFRVKTSYPEIKSGAYTTVLQDGQIMSDAPDVAALLQTDLFGDDKQLEFKPQAGENGGTS